MRYPYGRGREDSVIHRAALIVSLALIVAACSSGSSTTTTSGDTSSTTPPTDAETTIADVQADEGDESVVRVGIPTEILGLDVQGSIAAEQPVLMAGRQIFDTLVVRDGGEIVGRLAESWDNPSDTEWVFHLRQDATFHDGTPVTAADAQASLQRYIDVENTLASLLGAIDSMETPDDHTLVIHTSQPTGTLLSSLPFFFVAPADRINDEAFWAQPIGSGPFQVVEPFATGSTVVLEANESYWGGAPEVARLELIFIPEVSSRLTALSTGEIDLTWNIPPDQAPEVASLENIEYDTALSFSYYFLWFIDGEPFDDVRVRRAMWHALDVDATVNGLFGDMASVAKAPIPQSAFGAPDLEPYEYDPELARQLLAEAGYPEGFATDIHWSTGGGLAIQEMAETFIGYWREVGIEVTPLAKERPEFIEDFLAGNWNLHIQTNTVLTGDADYTLNRLYPCESQFAVKCLPEVDDLLARAAASIDQDERRDLYAEASQMMWDEAVGIFPADLRINAAWRSNIGGFAPPTDNIPDFQHLTVSG